MTRWFNSPACGQAADGTADNVGSAHLTYYWRPLHLSFVWDGRSEAIEVSHGGYAEPACLLIPAPIDGGRTDQVVRNFQQYCLEWLVDEGNWPRLVDAGVVGHIGELGRLVPTPERRSARR